MDFDDSDTPPPTLFDPARETDPRARAWAEREVAYVAEIAKLKSQLGDVKAELCVEKNKRAKLALELNRLRKQPPK